MRGKLTFAAGVGFGYLLGTRAGRERFDQISGKAKQVWESKTVQDAAHAVQEQAGRFYQGGKQMMSEQSHKMRQNQKNNRKRPHQEMPEHQEASWEAPVGFPVNTSY